MELLDPLTAESGVVLLGQLMPVMLSLVLPWRGVWNSRVAVAFVEVALAPVVSPLIANHTIITCCTSRGMKNNTGLWSAVLLRTPPPSMRPVAC